MSGAEVRLWQRPGGWGTIGFAYLKRKPEDAPSVEGVWISAADFAALKAKAERCERAEKLLDEATRWMPLPNEGFPEDADRLADLLSRITTARGQR